VRPHGDGGRVTAGRRGLRTRLPLTTPPNVSYRLAARVRLSVSIETSNRSVTKSADQRYDDRKAELPSSRDGPVILR
jgi:hypothetical protein